MRMHVLFLSAELGPHPSLALPPSLSAGINALITNVCNTRTFLKDVVQRFERLIKKHEQSIAMLNSFCLPQAGSARGRFAHNSTGCGRYALGGWPRRFVEMEMNPAKYCQIGGEELDGPDRARALQRSFECIRNKLCDAMPLCTTYAMVTRTHTT